MAYVPITVIARVRAKPEMKQKVKDELVKLLAPTRAEKGCINYDMHQALDDELQFLFHENWATEADLNAHLNSPHIKNWFAQFETWLAEPVEIKLWKKVG